MRYFKSGRLPILEDGNVDIKDGVLRGVVLAKEGEAKGHDLWLDGEFLAKWTAFAQEYPRGLKVRFGHPSMSNDALGTEVGRMKNIRLEDDQIKGDLYLYESADLSPTVPNAREWILAMAVEDPDAIMMSIVFQSGEPRVKEDDDRKYAEPISAEAVDLVDQGAATDALFSFKLNPHAFAVQAEQILGQHKPLDRWLSKNPEKAIQFLQNRYSMNQPKFSLLGWFQGKDQSVDLDEESKEKLNALEAKVTDLSTIADVAQAKADEAEAKVAELTAQIQDMESAKVELAEKLSESEKEVKFFKTNFEALGLNKETMPVQDGNDQFADSKTDGLTYYSTEIDPLAQK